MTPIIKWAGSKRQLLLELNQYIPDDYGKYVEPFVGSGALFFDLLPNKAILNDTNRELINMYCCLRDNPEDLKEILLMLEDEYNSLNAISDKMELFYLKRDEFNRNIVDNELGISDAALFIFLNKTCYNGLYRVNSQGLFNTPSGKQKSIRLYDDNTFYSCSKALKNATIKLGDYKEACKGLRKGDFVYFDSPYYDTFDTYQAGGFPEEEHIKLSKLYKSLSKRGIYCLLSNSDTDFIKDLYKEFDINIVPVKRMINCDGKRRTGTEVIIKNY